MISVRTFPIIICQSEVLQTRLSDMQAVAIAQHHQIGQPARRGVSADPARGECRQTPAAAVITARLFDAQQTVCHIRSAQLDHSSVSGQLRASLCNPETKRCIDL